MDGAGNAYVTGGTFSSDFPTTPGAYDTTHNGIIDAFVAQMYLAVFIPEGLSLANDPNGNGVWDSGETITAVPAWRNASAVALNATGTGGNVVVPGGVSATLVDSTADYGTVAAGATADCATATGNCYALQGTRTGWGHKDVTFDETLTLTQALVQSTEASTWVLHMGPSFADVTPSVFYYWHVETMMHRNITGGCTATEYCPLGTVNRGQMAIFISKAVLGGNPPMTGSGPNGSWDCTDANPNHFTDIPDGVFYCPHVHWMWANGITAGCTTTEYCPLETVNRGQMAIFIVRAMLGGQPPGAYVDPDTGRSYDCTDGQPNRFVDVSDSVFYCPHVHYMWARGITGGCSPTQYCPLNSINRAQMAVFIVKAFHLLLYGP